MCQCLEILAKIVCVHMRMLGWIEKIDFRSMARLRLCNPLGMTFFRTRKKNEPDRDKVVLFFSLRIVQNLCREREICEGSVPRKTNNDSWVREREKTLFFVTS